jgi:hypothetical protein
MTQDMQSDLAESRTQSREICEEARDVRATSATIMQETAQLRHSAQQVRAVHAQHLAAGVRRRQQGPAPS